MWNLYLKGGRVRHVSSMYQILHIQLCWGKVRLAQIVSSWPPFYSWCAWVTSKNICFLYISIAFVFYITFFRTTVHSALNVNDESKAPLDLICFHSHAGCAPLPWLTMHQNGCTKLLQPSYRWERILRRLIKVKFSNIFWKKYFQSWGIGIN